MNSLLIRRRINQDVRPFVFRLSDGTRVRVAHPDFVAVTPGEIAVLDPRIVGKLTRIAPLHVVAIEKSSRRQPKSGPKHGPPSK